MESSEPAHQTAAPEPVDLDRLIVDADRLDTEIAATQERLRVLARSLLHRESTAH